MYSFTALPTGPELEDGSGLDSESDEAVKKKETDTNLAEIDTVLKINTTSLSLQMPECAKVKGQPQAEHVVPPQISASTVISEKIPDWGSVSTARCSGAMIQQSGTAENISSSATMGTNDDTSPANKGVLPGAMGPSTDEMDDKLSHQPDMMSSKEEIIEEGRKINESLTLLELVNCDLIPEACPERIRGELGMDQDHDFSFLY